MAADIFAKICIAVENQTESLGEEAALLLAMRPYENLQRNLWWDVAVSKNAKMRKKLTRKLRALVKETWKLLSEGLQLEERGLDTILNEEYLARFYTYIIVAFIIYYQYLCYDLVLSIKVFRL